MPDYKPGDVMVEDTYLDFNTDINGVSYHIKLTYKHIYSVSNNFELTITNNVTGHILGETAITTNSLTDLKPYLEFLLQLKEVGAIGDSASSAKPISRDEFSALETKVNSIPVIDAQGLGDQLMIMNTSIDHLQSEIDAIKDKMNT